MKYEQEFTYNWFHIPTGKNGKSSQDFIDRLAFLKAMNSWNRQPQWKYWD